MEWPFSAIIEYSIKSHAVIFGERKGGTLAIFKALIVFVPEKGVEL